MQPEIVGIMNEPQEIGLSSYSSEMSSDDWYIAYHDFLVKCIDEYRTVKPDIIAIVQSCPYQREPYRIVQNPIQRPNVAYAIHIYYGEWNPPASYMPQYMLDYYNGNLAAAKEGLKQVLEDNFGLSTLQAIGATIVFEECGTCHGEPNATVFMQDLYDIMNQHNCGILQFTALQFPKHYQCGVCSFVIPLELPWSSHKLPNVCPNCGNTGTVAQEPRTTIDGIIADYTTASLNSIGQIWWNNMATSPIPSQDNAAAIVLLAVVAALALS